jgi:hypothetical protein
MTPPARAGGFSEHAQGSTKAYRRFTFVLNSTVDILPATPEDADALTRIAFAAKRYWGYPESWIQHWRDGLTITPEFVRNSRVYAAVSGGEPCAFDL